MNRELSGVIPVPEGTLGDLAKSLVDAVSEKLWQHGYRTAVGERFRAVVDQITTWLTPRLEMLTLRPINVRTGSDDRTYDVSSLVADARREGATDPHIVERSLVRERRESPLRMLLDARAREGAEPKGAKER